MENVLEQLTPEEVKERGLYSLEEDSQNSSVKDTKFFTLTPHPDPTRREEGWEKVTYYTTRKKPFS